MWKKSSKCRWDEDQCVLVRFNSAEGLVEMRSSDPTLVVQFSKPEWDAFIAGAKVGEFDFDNL